MKRTWLLLLAGLGFAALLATALLVGLREEPVYQQKPLRYWVIRLGSDGIHGAPKDAVEAIRSIGPKAVPFLLEWMPHRQPHPPAWIIRVWEWCANFLHIPTRQEPTDIPDSRCVQIAWRALGREGESAIPALARVINQPWRNMDDYSPWTKSVEAISYLGPDAIGPMLTAATNMNGQHELWELLKNFENLGTNGAPAVPMLIKWAKDPDYFVRAAVMSALGGIRKHPDLAVPVILAALQDSDSMVRRDAAEALGAFADDSDAVLPALVKTLESNDSEARGGALSGLGRIRNKPGIVVPLIAPYLTKENWLVARSAAYALLCMDNRCGLQALLRSPTDAGIRDIYFRAVEIVSSDEEAMRRQAIITNLAKIYARHEPLQILDLNINGKPVSQILNDGAIADAPLRLEEMLTLRRSASQREANFATFELPIHYDVLTNLGTVRLLCDADPNEMAGSEALIQECERAPNGNIVLIWDTNYEPPGRHFLQAELVLPTGNKDFRPEMQLAQALSLRGPLCSFVSTNELQFFPHADLYTDNGAFFHVKLAQAVGSYSVEITTISGQHIHTITGSTTNSIASVHWDLLYDGGKRYPEESFKTAWTVTFPDVPKFGVTNSTQTASRP